MFSFLDIRDFVAGIFLIIFGLFVVLYTSGHYHIGTLELMGPGFFPMVLGCVLSVLGMLVATLSFRRTVYAFVPPPIAIRPFSSILSSIAVFALLIERAGLIVTTIIVIVIAASAKSSFRLWKALLLGITLSLLSWIIFILMLKMTIPVLPW